MASAALPASARLTPRVLSHVLSSGSWAAGSVSASRRRISTACVRASMASAALPASARLTPRVLSHVLSSGSGRRGRPRRPAEDLYRLPGGV